MAVVSGLRDGQALRRRTAGAALDWQRPADWLEHE